MKEAPHHNRLLEILEKISADFASGNVVVKRAPNTAERTEAVRLRLERVIASPEERKVLGIIFKLNPELHPNDLKLIRKDCDIAGPLLLQYQEKHYPGTPDTAYLYISQRCQDPEFLGVWRQKETFGKLPDASLLLRRIVSEDGEEGVDLWKEIFRWKEEEPLAAE